MSNNIFPSTDLGSRAKTPHSDVRTLLLPTGIDIFSYFFQ